MSMDNKCQIFGVKYECMPNWCAVCGHLGHLYKKHGSDIHPLLVLVFKDLRAIWSMRAGEVMVMVEDGATLDTALVEALLTITWWRQCRIYRGEP